MNDNIIQQILQYAWICVIALIGSTVGFIVRFGKYQDFTCKKKITTYILGVITSMFTAYVTYEICFYVVENDRVSVAIAGLASFAGTDLLVFMQNEVFEYLKKRLNQK